MFFPCAGTVRYASVSTMLAKDYGNFGMMYNETVLQYAGKRVVRQVCSIVLYEH